MQLNVLLECGMTANLLTNSPEPQSPNISGEQKSMLRPLLQSIGSFDDKDLDAIRENQLENTIENIKFYSQVLEMVRIENMNRESPLLIYLFLFLMLLVSQNPNFFLAIPVLFIGIVTKRIYSRLSASRVRLSGGELLKRLDKSPSLINRGTYGETLLMKCAKSNSAAEMAFHIANSSEINDQQHKVELVKLVLSGQIGGCEFIINKLVKSGSILDSRDFFGNTALMLACKHTQNLEVINSLINSGADIEATDNSGKTPLIISAISSSSGYIVDFLLESGSIPNIRCNAGKTALDYAKENSTLLNTQSFWNLHDKSY